MNTVPVRSDQSSQFTSIGQFAFLRARDLEHSMGRRGNCDDKHVRNAMPSPVQFERPQKTENRKRPGNTGPLTMGLKT